MNKSVAFGVGVGTSVIVGVGKLLFIAGFLERKKTTKKSRRIVVEEVRVIIRIFFISI